MGVQQNFLGNRILDCQIYKGAERKVLFPFPLKGRDRVGQYIGAGFSGRI
jgi:hypothetical protein